MRSRPMDYVGIDYSVDLACSTCAGITRIRYSRLLALLDVGGAVACATCGRVTNHDWTTVSRAQQLFRAYLDRAQLVLEATYRPTRAW